MGFIDELGMGCDSRRGAGTASKLSVVFLALYRESPQEESTLFLRVWVLVRSSG